MADSLSPRKKKDKKQKKKGEKEKGADESEKEALLLDLNFENVESGKVTKVSSNLKDCPVTNVTVYNDRAEVTRTIFADVSAGTNELNIIGLSSKVDRNSVRVAGGKGAAVILEVSYNTRWEPKNKDDGSERSRLEKEQEELDAKIARFNEISNRINKETSWLENWASSLSSPQRVEGKEVVPSGPLFSDSVMQQATSFLEFYQKRLSDIDERRSTVKKSLKELGEQRLRVSKALQALSGGDTEQVHEIVVLLTAQAETKVELVLSYVVMDASWQATYDVRVQSDSDALSLTYYGNIVNNSLDDWTDAPLSLSTAQPSVGGAPPELTTKFVGFKPAYNAPSWGSHAPVTNRALFAAERLDYRQQAVSQPEPMPDMQVLTTSVQESSICTSFSIPRKSTILSDNKPHKVTIRMIQLTAKYTYAVIPKLSTHAYLKASIVNTSENYPFLAGDINVFMDGNFVAKSHIKAVSPNESFSIFLGTDDAIKVTYPPGVFFKDTLGLIRKSNQRTTKHTITIKNNKSKEISLAIFDQLPKSNDSQIKVKLLKPDLDAEKDVTLTEGNNLKWKKVIAAGKQVIIPFEYSVEWPHGQELTM